MLERVDGINAVQAVLFTGGDSIGGKTAERLLTEHPGGLKEPEVKVPRDRTLHRSAA